MRTPVDKMKVILPLVAKPDRTRLDVARRAKEFGIDPATLYRWLARSEGKPTEDALERRPRSDRGRQKLDPQVEQVIKRFLTHLPQAPNILETARGIAAKCAERGLPIPHYNTVRARIQTMLARRRYLNMGDDNFVSARAEHRCVAADRSLSAVSVEFHSVDVMISDAAAFPTGKAWVTVAIDCYSHAVIGICVSTGFPTEFEVGRCIARTLLPKNDLLSQRGVVGSWPCSGKPNTVISPSGLLNASCLKAACEEYVIQRKVVSNLDCSRIFVSKLRAGFDSMRVRVLRLAEFEKCVLEAILVYNVEKDSLSNVQRLRRFKSGLPSGSRDYPLDSNSNSITPNRILLDFMPYVERTIQRNGVMVEGIRYHGEALERWSRKKRAGQQTFRKLLFRRDPRTISSLWLRDPKSYDYHLVEPAGDPVPNLTWQQYRELRKRFNQDWILKAMERTAAERMTNDIFKTLRHGFAPVADGEAFMIFENFPASRRFRK